VENLTIASQIKLLRVLETGRVKRLGSNRETDVDVRLIAATNQDLHGLVMNGSFRADLFYRISQLTLTLPSLAVRKEDIGILVRHFLAEKGYTTLRLSPFILEVLLLHDWPGNVRELRDTVYAIALYAETDPVLDLSAELQKVLTDKIGSVASLLAPGIMGRASARRDIIEKLLSRRGQGTAQAPMDHTEKAPPLDEAPPQSLPTRAEEFVELFEACGCNLARMARRLGKHRVQMYRIATKLGVDIESLRS
jgi:DNA-binding NtrC family response regulator